MKEYAFTEWLQPLPSEIEKEEEMAYNEQIGLFHVQGEHAFRKGNIDMQHSVSLFMLKGEISIQTPEKRIVVLAPAYIEFIEPHQWCDLKTDTSFEGCLLITRRELFLQAAEYIRPKVTPYIYKHVQEPILTLKEEDIPRIGILFDMLRHTLMQKENNFLHEMLENTLRSLVLEIWNIVFRTYKKGNEDERTFQWDDTLPRFLYLMHTHCRSQHSVKWYADQLCLSPDALSARLKRTYGKSANQLINESLMEEAKTCLLNPSLSIQDVAEKLCFSDQASFSKFFKRYGGMTPGKFKKQHSASLPDKIKD